MKLSTRTRYGARAMIDIAGDWGQHHTKRKDIVARQGISESYLENILIALKSRGLLTTVRGANGGFMLSRSPESITLYDVFEALDGNAAPVDCVDTSRCPRDGSCAMKNVYMQLKQAQDGVLRGISLRDLLEKSRHRNSSDYSI